MNKSRRLNLKLVMTLLGSGLISATTAMAGDKQVYWGDSHLHTSYSTDAGLFGDTLDPGQAYRFAKGETVVSSTGTAATIVRPLDWLVVADHAENLGLAAMAREDNPLVTEHPWGKKFHQAIQNKEFTKAYSLWIASDGDPMPGSDMARTSWDRMLDFSRQYNEPGKFTSLLGYEWSSTPQLVNLHRVVVFRDDEDRVGEILPFSAFDSEDPEDLWDWLASYEEKTGGKALAIPHNGNLSNGLMFDDVTYSGGEITREYAEKRSRWEPLYEVSQIKGDAEAHPVLSPDDQFADFETWDSGTFGHEAKTDDMLPREYAREVLKRGLVYEEKLGVNPFNFGLVGATDSHTSLATTREENFFGKVPVMEPQRYPYRWEGKMTGVVPLKPGEEESRSEYGTDSAASGLQGVWADENTRAALFDAMQSKETYATTGTRIKVRVFGGTDFTNEDVNADDFAKRGYAGGVPMGGELKALQKAPRMMVQASKDPDGANLDRIQIIKGWLDAEGNTHEQVIDVACAVGLSGPRNIVVTNGKQQCDGEVGSNVDKSTATYQNSFGSTALHAVWEDSNFDPAQRAFYYVRVLEIPTPRWTTYDSVRDKRELPENVLVEIQDRAYTSPIHYRPAPQG